MDVNSFLSGCLMTGIQIKTDGVSVKVEHTGELKPESPTISGSIRQRSFSSLILNTVLAFHAAKTPKAC